MTTVEPSTLLRLDGQVLLDVLQTAPALHSALDVPGRSPPAAPPTPLVDDPAWGEA